MELNTVSFLTCVDILFVLYMTKKYKTIFPLLTATTIIYTISYVLPYYLQFDESSYDLAIFDSSYAYKAVCYYYSFKLTMDVVYYFKYKRIGSPAVPEQVVANTFQVAGNYAVPFYLIIMAFIVQLLAINDIDQIIAPVDRFFSDNPIASNSMTVLMLILFSAFYVIYSLSERKNRLMLVLAISMCLFYPVLISSRSVVLPFLIMACIQVVVGRKYLMAGISFCCSILFYIAAISDRTELGLGNFIAKLSSSFSLVGDAFNMVMMSVSGIATLAATLSGLDSGSVDVRPDPILFLQYISPIPSFWLSTRIFDYTSLSEYLGIDQSVLGINTDVISESILWLSWYGPPLIGAALGYIFASVEQDSINKVKNILFTSLFLIASLYFIILSNVSAMRASSRLLVYSYLLYLLYKLFCTKRTAVAQVLVKN